MQGTDAASSSAARAVPFTHALAVLAALAMPSVASAQEFGRFACAPPPNEVEAAIETHLALRPRVLHEVALARQAYRDISVTLRAAQRGELVLSQEDHANLVAAQARVREGVERLDDVHCAWAACHDELVYLRRFHPRQAHPLRLSLGFDGALWNMDNSDDDLAEEGYPYVMYRTPSAALQIGWEHYYTRRVGLRVNGTLSVGQGRFRACSFAAFVDCYGQPAAGAAFTAAADVGLRV